MPTDPAKMQQLVKQRVEHVRGKHALAVRILSDISNKLSTAESSIGKSSAALDNSFEVTADMLLEQAQKQLNMLDAGIQAVREEIAGLRKEPQEKPEQPPAPPAQPAKADTTPAA